MKKLFIVFCLAALVNCDKKKFFDGPEFYQDGFENYSELNELLLPDDVIISGSQITRDGNSITVDSTFSHSGNKSLKFVAVKSEADKLSKCSLFKQNMAFWEGETMQVTAWYYIAGTDSLQWLFLFDIEEQAAIGAGPGIRLALVNNQLRVEHKFNEKDILQSSGNEVVFPRDQWVEVKWQVKLSQKHEGSVKLWQNGQLIIDSQNERTLPKDILYSLQGTKR